MAPPIIETVTYWPDCGKYNWKLYKNGFLVILGKYDNILNCYLFSRTFFIMNLQHIDFTNFYLYF